MFKCPICWFHKINTSFLLQLNQNLHEFSKLPRFTLANIFYPLFFFYVKYFRKLPVVILLYFLLYLGKSLYFVPLFLSFYTFFLFLRISPTSIPFFYNCSTSSSLYPHFLKCPNLSLSLLLFPFFLFFSGRMFLFLGRLFAIFSCILLSYSNALFLYFRPNLPFQSFQVLFLPSNTPEPLLSDCRISSFSSCDHP